MKMTVSGLQVAPWVDTLITLEACDRGIRWARKYPTVEDAWSACENPSWMLWLAARVAVSQDDRSKVVLAAAACVRLARIKNKDRRVLCAIEAAEQWARNPTDENRCAAVLASNEATEAIVDALVTEEKEAARAAEMLSLAATRNTDYLAYVVAAAALHATCTVQPEARVFPRREMAAIVRGMVACPNI